MIINLSDLNDGDTIGFNEETDVLHVDDVAISAAEIGTLEGNPVGINAGGKSVFLIARTIEQLTSANVTFADGSKLLVGDNTTGTDADAQANTLIGGTKDDMLIGLAGDDILTGGGGDDDMSGRADKDLLNGDGGNDSMDGGFHDDVLIGAAGADTLRGGDHSDIFDYSSPVESPATNGAFDLIEDFKGSGAEQDRIHYLIAGTAENYDESTNTNDPGFEGAKETASELFLGSDGIKKYAFVLDTIGYLFADLDGDFEAEFCVALQNVFIDDFGFDFIRTRIGTPGADNLQGTPQSDTMSGGGSSDKIGGGDGDDKMGGGEGDDTMDGGNGNDRMSGGDGNDRMSGADGNDRMSGGGGNDRMSGGDGDDREQGGNGNDIISGGSGADLIQGDDGTDNLQGGTGNDSLSGGLGNDAMQGGLGNDTMTGGGNLDRFIFNTALNAATNRDIVQLFSHAEDTMVLSKAVFTELSGAAGAMLAAGEFALMSAAAQADDRILYNEANGLLLYDADGGARGNAVAFARVVNFATAGLAADDFLLAA